MSTYAEMIGRLWGSSEAPAGMVVSGVEKIDSAMGVIRAVAFVDARGRKCYGLSGKLLTDIAFDEPALRPLLEAAHSRLAAPSYNPYHRDSRDRQTVFHSAGSEVLDTETHNTLDRAIQHRSRPPGDASDEESSDGDAEAGSHDDTEHPDSGAARERMVREMRDGWQRKPAPAVDD